MIQLLFYPQILLLSFFSIYYDLKYRKVKNSFITSSILYSICINLLVAFLLVQKGYPLGADVLYSYIKGFIFTLTAVFMLYFFDFFSAGDAKLILAFSLMLAPISFFSDGSFYTIPFFTNIVIVSLAYIFFQFVFNFKRIKLAKETLKELFEPKLLLNLFLRVYSLWFINSFILEAIGLNNPLTNIALMVILFQFVFKRLNPNASRIFFVSAALIRLIFEMSQLLSVSYWMSNVGILLSFLLLRIILINLGYLVFTKEVKIEELKPGDLIADKIKIVNEKKGKEDKIHIIKTKEIQISIISILGKAIDKEESIFFDYIRHDPRKGLNKKSIEILNDLKKRKIFAYDSVRVHQLIPFAPLIVIAIILTVVFKANVLGYIFMIT